MTTIYKYPIAITDLQKINMPLGYKLLAAQVQHGNPQLWAEVNPSMPDVPVTLAVYGTGHTIPDIVQTYVDTIQISNGGFVFHVYEVSSRELCAL